MIGIGVSINKVRYDSIDAFRDVQWQLLTVTFWNNITENWN
jgi:hypothetical protein